MSNGRMAALEVARGAPWETFSGLEAEIMETPCRFEKPKTALRATDELIAELHFLRLYQGLSADNVSNKGARPSEPSKDLYKQKEYFEPFHKPRGYRIPTSELDRPPSDPDNGTLRTPIVSRSFGKPLPESKIRELEEKFKSLEPGLTRKHGAQCT